MNRLSHYLARAMVFMSLAILAVLTGLAALFTLMDELRGADQSSLNAMLYTLLDVPSFLNDTLVIAVLAGSTVALALLARSNELLILHTGLGHQAIVRAALVPGLLAAAAWLLNTEYLLPFAAGLEQEHRFDTKHRQQNELQWLRSDSRHVHVAHILPGERLEGIRVYEYSRGSVRLKALSYADGAWLQGGLWKPEGLRRFALDEAGLFLASPDRNWFLPVPEQLSTVRLAPESLSMQFLHKHIRRLDARGIDNTRYARAFWTKLLQLAALPLAGPLALVLVLGVLRSWPYTLKAGLGGLVGIAYYAVDKNVYYLGVVHEFNPLACAVVAPGLLLAATLILLPRLQRPVGSVRA